MRRTQCHAHLPPTRHVPEELQRRLGYPPPEMTRRGKVCLGRSNVGTLVGVGLCTGTRSEAQPVHFRFESGAGMVRRRQAKVDPVHSVPSGEQCELDQGRQLVAGARARVGEAGGDLVFPARPGS
jgi:hypothetical protein